MTGRSSRVRTRSIETEWVSDGLRPTEVVGRWRKYRTPHGNAGAGKERYAAARANH